MTRKNIKVKEEKPERTPWTIYLNGDNHKIAVKHRKKCKKQTMVQSIKSEETSGLVSAQLKSK